MAGAQPRTQVRLGSYLFLEVAKAERDVAGLVLQRQMAHLGGHRVRRVAFQE